MSKKTIHIDQEKCTGCGLCTSACHEGAIGLINGKAALIHADYCDGLGACLPVCPTGAISFVDEAGKKVIQSTSSNQNSSRKSDTAGFSKSWPLQIQLVAINAPFFENADLLIAADCTAFAYPSFYETFSKGKVVLIGCPKLDAVEYSKKLTEIIKTNNIKSLAVIRMEVPCCTGLFNAVETALQNSGKNLPFESHIVGIDGNLR
jgi:ferredoxin